MSQEADGQKVDTRKRKFLIAATSAVGGVAVAGVAVPLVMSMLPSARAKAAGAPVEVDISKIEPGMLLTAEWRGKPVWVVNRTKEMLDLLGKHNDKLVDPNSEQPQQPVYCKNATRSIKPEFLVAVGICTHLGCSPTYRKEVGAEDLGADWPGGFLCPCHGSRFDLAARVFKNVPAPTNLVIPPHQYLSAGKIQIGVDAKGA
ncbi:MAG: ubiquinol-cytochrome c reductase iron-sulfur subunit [Thiobacillus sp. SCN 63-374]|uniref:ubiquinol-cytochrome c reductase iron-sulfur subunit n=1 Tax=Thiobacillus sp. TaxID=924 RepID=UPI00086C4523|nr:ubiquinol-cytochrome c reductase iron-sulfur subunit [Thiobacillus sp.]MBN8778035.1 ubiquinol-cytochrome c reductase iron-sulfur subunit [Thiobacillus sp.]MBS0311885.1 ubiquinol-cytochrome c reductase iron-sulfur subunit [Pseudomonadota bacterium]ODU40463.1 MAG: ubiquinol-cytochrome c reductase iron-sulfur subunit [Thiobacillus sp. SCN 63-374]TXH72958.1 MAG: ubiquinol-cytochrome c reductase iron-sulfur subunit [Thiobacillus sp.]